MSSTSPYFAIKARYNSYRRVQLFTCLAATVALVFAFPTVGSFLLAWFSFWVLATVFSVVGMIVACWDLEKKVKEMQAFEDIFEGNESLLYLFFHHVASPGRNVVLSIKCLPFAFGSNFFLSSPISFAETKEELTFLLETGCIDSQVFDTALEGLRED